MTYNMDFLFVAMILLVLVLWHYYSQRRPDNLNNRAFLIFVCWAVWMCWQKS